ncbi:PH domain-containing protein [Corynebacterium ulceribovis]|uniref:PH domain-containing protein n=1 Tax=Corynebacterium ulceribovis TaxID=487732 RepID=UPI0003700E6F|nr:PH domain-containing protein [Corynebacterium ulceribovis]
MAFPDDELYLDEEVFLDTNPSFGELTWPALELVLFSGVAAMAIGVLHRGVLNTQESYMAQQFVFVVWLFLVLWRTVLPALSWLGTRFLVTDRRVMLRRGVLKRRVEDIWYGEMTGVSRRGSTLLVRMHPQERPVPFEHLPNTKGIVRLVQERRNL